MLCPAAKGRAIAIPVDLDSQVNNLFVKSNNIVQKTAMSWRMSARNAARRDSVLTASRDYRNIIERLQVGERACVCVCLGGWGVGVLTASLSGPCRTSCRPWRTSCGPWSRLSCRSLWTCCTGRSCSSRRTLTHAGSVRAEASSASQFLLPVATVMEAHACAICTVSLTRTNTRHVISSCPCVCVCVFRLIKHTKQLLEENEERLCIKVLQTLREMMTKDRGYGEKVAKQTLAVHIHTHTHTGRD